MPAVIIAGCVLGGLAGVLLIIAAFMKKDCVTNREILIEKPR